MHVGFFFLSLFIGRRQSERQPTAPRRGLIFMGTLFLKRFLRGEIEIVRCDYSAHDDFSFHGTGVEVKPLETSGLADCCGCGELCVDDGAVVSPREYPADGFSKHGQ